MRFRTDKAILGLAGAALIVLPAVAQAQSTPRVIGYVANGGVGLGQGWDSQKVAPMQTVCVEFDTANSTQAQTVTSERTMVSDKYAYSNALNVSADVQVKSASGASVDAKASYASKKQLNSTYLNVVELVTVDNGWLYAAPKAMATSTNAATPVLPTSTANPAQVQLHQRFATYFQNVAGQRTSKARNAAFANGLQRLYADAGAGGRVSTPPALRQLVGAAPPSPPPTLLRAGSSPSGSASVRLTSYALSLTPDQFQRQCGDSFVAAIQQGGELAATYTFMTNSEDQQQQIAASLGVSYGTPVVSGSATVSVSQAIESSSEKIGTSITYYRSGGSGDPVPTTLDEIDAVTKGFAASVAAKPQPFQMMVMDYKQLPNFPSNGTGMPELTGFQKLAWEYGKAQTLFTTASEIYSDLQSPTPTSRYLTARWGYSPNDIARVQQTAGERIRTVVQAASTCVGAAPTAIAQACSVQPFDDLGPRVAFPLPISAGNVGEVVAALWGPTQTYQSAVFKRWIQDVNDNRCYFAPADPLFCRYDSELASLQSGISAKNPGYAALELVDQPGTCLNYGNTNSYMSAQPCPNDANSRQFFVRYDPNGRRLYPMGEAGNCVFAMRIHNGLQIVSPGYAVIGDANCGAMNPLEDINRNWEFRDSTGRDGKPDGTGAYLVVVDNGSPEFNSCLDSYSNSSAWIAPCTNPKRVRVWMTAPGN